jgi:2-(1,2-epoxy-1,2-dihydrophenyl)acetyl-CoA isomerase
MSADVLLVHREGPVTVLTLNRPRARNALDRPLLHALAQGLGAAAADPGARALIVTGAGGAFCSGADLKAAMAPGGDNPLDEIDAAIGAYHDLIRAVVDAPKPVIAAVDGAAVGFGCDLALACDLRVLSTEAYLQEKFVKIGLMPDGGGTFWLPRLVGLGRALEMMLLGEPVPAEEARALGLANRVVPPARLLDEAMKLAQQLAKGPPLAYAEIKKAVRAGLGGTIDGALALEKRGQTRCLTSGDCMEGVLAWAQKREPVFEGK